MRASLSNEVTRSDAFQRIHITTLAWLEETGWYKVDYRKAAPELRCQALCSGLGTCDGSGNTTHFQKLRVWHALEAARLKGHNTTRTTAARSESQKQAGIASIMWDRMLRWKMQTWRKVETKGNDTKELPILTTVKGKIKKLFSIGTWQIQT